MLTGTIRLARQADLPQLTAIYNQAIQAGRCTCDTAPFAPGQRQGWFAACQEEDYPLFVYERCSQTVGYAYLSPYREGRPALRTVAEISYYVDFQYHGQGIGGKLLRPAIEEARRLGYRNLLAILLECNPASIHLLEKHGFSLWGSLPQVAQLAQGWYSHLYYGRAL